MFNLTTKIVLAASIFIVGGVSAANAQITNNSSIKATVASSFVIKDQTFPAGIYTIERTPSTIDSPSLLVIRGDNGDAMIFDTIIGQSNETANSTDLVFETAGGTCYLSRIVIKGQTAVNDIPKTKNQISKIAADAANRQVLTIANTGL
ncbi:hypothetical protein BH10ACI2_BH10ACI2_18370 [soil metagenome]